MEIAEKRAVLFLDDDEIVLQSLKRGLLGESYNKLFAKSSQEALEILQREEVHVIVADMRMPEMTGLEFLRIIRKEYPCDRCHKNYVEQKHYRHTSGRR